MTDHQMHFGRKFYLDKKKGYWFSTDSPRIYAHRWVWINLHGPIPKGCHIHHIDENKNNNSPENLMLMSSFEHLSFHMKSEERREVSRKQCDKIRHLTKEWHASIEGRAWHKFHAVKSKLGKWEPKTYFCQVCNKSYETTKRSNTKFCSNPCKSKFRRDEGIDDIQRKCQKCEKEFTVNKYAKRKFCSRKCSY